MTRTVLVAALVVLFASVAAAQTSGGYLAGGELAAGVVVSGSGNGGGSSGGGSSSGGGATPECTAQGVTGSIRYRAATEAEAARLAPAGPRVEELNPGNGILVARPNPADEGTWYVKSCGDAQAGYIWSARGAAPPAPPPAPPSAAEMWDRVPLPMPEPSTTAGAPVTGLPTWVWDASGSVPRSVSAVIRGYQSTATALPVRWIWDMTEAGPTSLSNPPGTVTSSVPGSRDYPAGEYAYETRGSYRVRLTVEWTGTFTYADPSGGPATRPLGTSERTTIRQYDVGEIRPVLVSR